MMHFTEENIDTTERSRLLFSGEIIVFQKKASLIKLIKKVQEIAEEIFCCKSPPSFQSFYNAEEYREKIQLFRDICYKDEFIKHSFKETLKECGVVLETTFWDRLVFRITPHGKIQETLKNSFLPYHRDTWGPNIYSQVNWWAPLYPITEERTFAIYPDYWNISVKNTTDTWDYKKYIQAVKVAPQGLEADYPSAPQIIGSITPEKKIPIVIELGDVLCFSSAHLHSSLPNTSEEARFSLETRTLHDEDFHEKRKAQNCDNANNTPHFQWFRHIETNKKMETKEYTP